MTFESILGPLLGGALIGLAATLMLLLNGRVAGVSGILGGFVSQSGQRLWQGSFLAGLICGGLIITALMPEQMINTSDRSLTLICLAGLFVGYGTSLGSGCTSGHGVCGISRFSLRSLLATLTFIVAGIVTVATLRLLGNSL
jgi:uncharacterized membrane protein YedE/YeeE